MREWLKTIRLKRGLTMLALSSKLDISESYYSMIESGGRRPSVETAQKIADELKFNWTRFFKEVKEVC